ncbi:hypothetical protein [Vagococcus fluvialis]|uniref:hypothetical protein n=1 Tax=Vagococcus fluvialis TaxID=2738 RepID=UPI0037ADA4A2
MYSIFLDEKGPQERFTISSPFSMRNKLAYGTDEIYGYIGNIWRIENSKINKFSSEYEGLEKNYLEKTQNPNRELKGSVIVKGNFSYGVASLKNKNTTFFSEFFKLLMKYQSDNFLFSINKMSVIVDSKLLNWFYLVDNKRIYPDIRVLKYIITKFLTIEAKEVVIASILDPDKTVKEVLREIELGMSQIIDSNRKNKRMTQQLQGYKDVIKVIKNTRQYNNIEYSKDCSFDWHKVTYDLSLWLDEKLITEKLKPSEITFYLDDGIDIKYFNELDIGKIHENCDSSKIVGLRVTDMLVVVAGNYIKNLSKDCQYDYNNPEKVVMINKKWFELSEEQFDLLKLMAQYYLGGSTYSFIVDTYFDQERLFESFLRYIDNYRNYKYYRMKSANTHVQNHFEEYAIMGRTMYQEFFNTSKSIRQTFGSLEEAISERMLRPV